MKHLYFVVILIAFGCNRLSNHSEAKEIWGERLMLFGDFDGDNETDTLHEKYISQLTHEQINKYYEIDYDSMVALTVKQKPISLLVSTQKQFETLKITSSTGQLFGLKYLVNLGDNNKNQKDEIALIVDWADWSSINSFQIYELNDSLKWKNIQSYEIRDYDNTDSIFMKKGQQIKIKAYNKLSEPIDSVIQIN